MFQIPEDLTVFSVAGLEDLRRVAQNELSALRASITSPDSVTDEQLERGESLKGFIELATSEIDGRAARAARFEALTPVTPVAVEDVPSVEELTATTTTATTETVVVVTPTEVLEATTTTSTTPARVEIAALASQGTGTATAVLPKREFTWGEHRVVAGSDIPDMATGTDLDDWLHVAKAFVSKTRGYPGSSRVGRQSVATIHRDYTDGQLVIDEKDSDEVIHTKLAYAADETRLPGNSLVAANGWCSPSETLYDTCLQISTDGLINLPEIVARRGGIRHNQGIEFDAIFGDGTGFNILTEAQVIADTAKTCVEIPCPPFVDDRLKVEALCLTGSILQNRAYPEFVADFVRGAVAAQAHNVSRQIIADIVAGSGAAIDLSPLANPADATAGSGFLAALEIAAMDIRYRLRLPMGTTLEAIFPFWALAQVRADLSRRTGVAEMAVTNEMINAWMAIRGIRAQWVYNFRDAFSAAGVGPGADTPITALATEVTVPIYPAGTWVLARLDVIRIDSLYDSVNLTQNLVTQLFVEDGFAAMRRCPLSRLYTLPLCPSGITSGVDATRTCA
jgi:hypothetical protein